MERILEGIRWAWWLGNLLLKVCLVVCFCLWVLGSSHAGHFLGWNEFGAFADSASAWITKGWR
jgi:hypothetical protein